MLLPEPVGATNRTSAPASAAATISPWPGRKSASPKVPWSTASAAADGRAGEGTGGKEEDTEPR